MEMNFEQIAAEIVRQLAPVLPPVTAQSMSFQEFSVMYLESHAKVQKKTWKQDERRLNGKLLPAFGNCKLTNITRLDVLKFHREMGKTAPYAANRHLEQMAKMFKLAQEWGVFPQDKLIPTSGISPFKEFERERFLNEQECVRLVREIAKVNSHQLRVLLWLYLLTGCRKSELLKAKWCDVDIDRWELRIPSENAKNGISRVVTLTEEAAALLSSLPQRGIYVFKGRKPGTRLKSFDTPWQEVRRRANLQDIRLHDLRRTVGSWMAQSGYHLQLIATVLGHEDLNSTRIYARFGATEVRDALQDHAKRVAKLANQSPAS